VRRVILIVTLAFIGLLATLTVLDFIHNGVNALGVISILILVLFSIGIVGALRNPPSER
jgi:hypothetical protein